ncbi:MAG: CHAT domain-containing protein [Pelagibacterales bacterium]|nr:CHAT domain-containing protein [Pelagibacterales bacterium]
MYRIQLVFLFLFLSSSSLKSQTWQVYSDSIYKIMQSGDWKDAYNLIDETDELLDIQGFVIDTTYADYLYRRGVLLNIIEENYSASLENILNAERIWKTSKIKNNRKLMLIYYWLGDSQLRLTKDEEAIKSYELSINYNIKNDSIDQYILLWSNFSLGQLYYLDKEHCEKSEEYDKKVLLLNDKYKLNLYYPVWKAALRLALCAKKDKEEGYFWFKTAQAYINLEPDSVDYFITTIAQSSYSYTLEKDWLQSKNVLEYAEEIITDKESICYGYLLTEYGNYYFAQDLFTEANNNNLKALDIYKSLLRTTHKKTIELYTTIGLNYWLNDKPFEAIKFYLLAIENAKRNKEFDQERINSFYGTISDIYAEVGDNIKFKEYLILSRENGDDSAEKDGDFYMDEAEYYLSIADLDNAYQSLIKAEELYKDSSDYNGLYDIYSLAMSLAMTNKIFTNDKARYFLELITEIKPHLDDEDRLWAEALEIDVLILEFEWVKAHKILKRLEPIVNEEEYGALYISIKSSLASTSFQLGNIESGLEQLDACIEYVKKRQDVYNINLLQYYINGGLMTALYMPEIAMKYLTPAKEIIDKHNMQNTTKNAEYLVCIGFVFANLGNPEDAYFALSEAINIWDKEKYIDNIFYYTSANIKLARLDIDAQIKFPEKDLFKQAYRRIEKSEKIAKEYGGNNEVLLADVYATRSLLLLYSDKFVEANEYFLKSIKIYDEKGLSVFAAGQKIMYAMSLYFTKEETKGIELLESIIEDEKLPDNIKGQASIMLYKIYYNYSPSKAIELLFSTIKIDKEIMLSSYQFMSDEGKQRHLSGAITNRFEWLNSHLLISDMNSKFLIDFMDVRAFYRSILLSNSNKKANKLIRKQEYQHLSSKIDELHENRVILNKFIEGNRNISEIQSLEKKVQEIERFITYELQKSGLENDEISYKMIVDNLLQDESYVEIIRINKAGKNFNVAFTDTIYYAAIIISKDKAPELIILDKENRFENELLPLYYSYTKGNQRNKLDEYSYSLYMKKIIDKVGESKIIYLSPDGIYNNLSISTLYNTEREKYILETADIRIVSGARGFVTNKTSEPEIYEDNNVVVIGNPKFDLSKSDATFTTDELAGSRDVDVSNFETFTRSGISQLPGTGIEINKVKNLFEQNKWNVTLSEGVSANEISIKEVNSPRVMHIATHGFFFPQQKNDYDPIAKLMGLTTNTTFKNPLMRSGLLFSGAQNTIRGENLVGENGVLTSLEARDLDLTNTELVVLSACETGVGDFVSGEGVYGLQRSILEAGAENVIMSLWKVDDKATQILMTIFYENWIEQGMTTREALKQAQITIKNTDGYSSPYYWGAFVLIGN